MAAPLIARIMVEYAAQKGGAPTPPGTAAGGGRKASKAAKGPKLGEQLAMPGMSGKPEQPKMLGFEDAMATAAKAPQAPKEDEGDVTQTKWHKRMVSMGQKGIEYAKNNSKGMLKSAGQAVGVQFTLGSILKQSQIFTGYLGTIFQLMGALVDVILAPFLPVFIPLIKHIASYIPIVAEVAKEIFGFVSKTFVAIGQLVKGFFSLIGINRGLSKNVVAGIKKALVYVVLTALVAKLTSVLLTKIFGNKSKLEMLQSVFYKMATRPGSIYVRDIFAGKGMIAGNKAAGKRGLRMGRLGMRSNLLMLGMTGLLTRGFGMFKGGLNLLGNQVKIVAGGVTSLDRGGKIGDADTRNRFQKFTSWANDVRAGMWTRLGSIRTNITEKVDLLKAKIADKVDMLRTKTGEFLTNVRTKISTALDTVRTKISGAIETTRVKLAEGLTNVRTNIASSLETVSTKVGGAIDTVRTSVGQKITTMQDILGPKIEGVKTKVGDWVTTGGDKLSELRTGLAEKIASMSKNVGDKVGKVKDGILDLPSTMKGLFGGITDALGGAFGRAKDLIAGAGAKAAEVGKGIMKFGRGMFDKGKNMISEGAKKVTTMVDAAGDRVNKFYGGIKEKVGSKLTSLADTPAGKFATQHLGKASKFGKSMVLLGRYMPGIGAAAEVVYGGMKVVEDIGKGRSWGQIGARVGATAGLATAAFFDPTGVASAAASIGGHMVLDKAFDKGHLGSIGKRQEDVIKIEVTERSIDGLDVDQNTYVRKRTHLNQEPPITVGRPPLNFARDY